MVLIFMLFLYLTHENKFISSYYDLKNYYCVHSKKTLKPDKY